MANSANKGLRIEPLHEALLKLATELEPEASTWPPDLAADLYYRYCHAPRPTRNGHDPIPAPSKQTLANALETSTDEDRLSYAEDYAKQVLALTNLEDAIYFRTGVLRKETSALITYQKQRDHSVHTLHNYLLGWYLFSHSGQIRSQFTKALEKRKGKKDNSFVARRFAELWCYVSLLHDVGYIFEGTIETEKIDLTDDMVRKGAHYALDYFADVFWRELHMRTADLRRTGQELLKIRLEPDEGRGGAGTIAYFLRNMGDLSALASELKLSEGFPSDGFSLWALHYEKFGSPEMVEKIKGLETALYHLMEQQQPNNIPRHLDHGICGGLLLLKFSSWWFRAVFEARRATPKPLSAEDKIIQLVEKALGSHIYRATHWWTSVVWATAAVALHNVQQHPEFSGHTGALTLSEDPLAYLGILVDILQEWDRHSVRRITTIPLSRRRINSRDIRVGQDDEGVIHIVYYCRDAEAHTRQSNMERDLDKSLADWKSLVKVSFLPHAQSLGRA